MCRLLPLALLLTSFLHAGESNESGAASLWSLQPVKAAALPAAAPPDWPLQPMDYFILAKIREAGHTPAPPADRRTLVRRAYLDLHGLPPTEEQTGAFLHDERLDAWPRLIDALLDSPRYGERWGRHWLDVARYADSNGMDENISHPEAWRYRDYVVDAFNRDKPFDQFITEQLAGDLLPAASPEQRQSQLTALGFLSVGPKMLACDDPDKMRRDIADEQIDTTGRAFLGMTLGCARCHDHKFDPISAKDYYGLAGIFMSTRTLTKYNVVAEMHEHLVSNPSLVARHQQIASLQQDKNRKETPEEEKACLETLIASLGRELPPLVKVLGVTESPTEDAPVHLRGNYLTLGEMVPRRLPLVLAGPQQAPMPKTSSGRLELARWIGSPDNPLTARVIANRIWRWHFGRGLVPTPDNFGQLGVPPTHPELLDHFATRLVQSHWSLKALHREIMGSATWQQSAAASPGVKQADPENQLYARWQPRRMEAEVLRDSILMASGRLDPSMGGSLLEVAAKQYVDIGMLPEYEKKPRRTLYLPVFRSSGYDGLNAFDFPDPAVIEGDRRSSTVSPQALYLMNSPLVHQSSSALAGLLLSATPDLSTSDRVAWLIRHLFAREATPAERLRGEAFLDSAPPDGKAAAWAAMARVLFASNEFLYIE